MEYCFLPPDMKGASAYAKTTMIAPEVRAACEKLAAEQHKRPYDLAISDYFKGRNLLSSKTNYPYVVVRRRPRSQAAKQSHRKDIPIFWLPLIKRLVKIYSQVIYIFQATCSIWVGNIRRYAPHITSLSNQNTPKEE